MTRQHVVLCEGFDDRSFWSGWLRHLGCADPTNRGRSRVNDAWGRPVVGGRYLFRTPAGSGVLVQPFQGRPNARRAAEEYLRNQVYRPDRLILNLDSDADGVPGESARDAIRQIVRDHDGEVAPNGDPLTVGETRVFSVIWECEDAEPTPGVPPKQSLERLVSAAIQAAYPDRGPTVDHWLQAEPRAEVDHKNYSYSYLAKWYADHGADDFLRAIWRDNSVAVHLQGRLESTGAWEPVASLVAD